MEGVEEHKVSEKVEKQLTKVEDIKSSNQEDTVTTAKSDAQQLLYHHHHHVCQESSLTFQRSFFAAATQTQTLESIDNPDSPTVHHIHLHHNEKPHEERHLRRRRPAKPADRTTKTSDKFSKLENLKMLYKEGYLKRDEYMMRRSQIVDELTGTSSTGALSGTEGSSIASAYKGRRKARSLNPYVIPRPPPKDFSAFTPERAIKHTFDLKTRQWTQRPFVVRLDDTPFARGGLRLVYHLQEDLSENRPTLSSVSESDATEYSVPSPPALEVQNVVTKKTSYVAKLAIDPFEDAGTYFRDVEMQHHCGLYADLYNSYDPPRHVEFCKAWILELVDRDNSPLCGVEKFIDGDASYRKHNNNFGYVNEDERNTPQAFSHFTYEASAHTMIVVDIQGVGDMYTDPQIHTIAATDFGKGNLGMRGMKRFLETHRCNSICRYLKLPPVNPKYGVDGTVPAFKHMRKPRVNSKQFSEGHYYENSPYLRKVLTEKSLTSTSTTGYSTSTTSSRQHGRRQEVQFHPNFYHVQDDDECCKICPAAIACNVM